ncbi:VOC family protein [Candidatus Poribacteria bacterium]|nr:VOC family protein [Candidatus Poribacteria bacterium]MYG05567.1 VOC family protein [Candidatus Poribacteria bacterium]MYK20810.1 VOC family protein [Candidatus Poribacteria bacterium]
MGGKCRAFFIFDPDGNEIEFNDLYCPDHST